MTFLGIIFGADPHQDMDEVKTALDLVTYAANLTSNPSNIDPLLDTVRRITAGLTPGQTPSEENIQILLGVYLKIEVYLTKEEPIRTFSKNELRHRLSTNLRAQLEAYEVNDADSVVQ